MIKGQLGGVYFEAWDNAAGSRKSGDAANILATISKDGGAGVAVEGSVVEVEHISGLYWLPLSATETDADSLLIIAASSTEDVVINPILIDTVPPAGASLGASLLTRKPVTRTQRTSIIG